MPGNDPVRNPAHYVGNDPTYECIKVAEAWSFHKCAYLFNVLKYICRAGKKDPRKVVEDLKKAIFYLERKIMILEQDMRLPEDDAANPYRHLPSYRNEPAGLRRKMEQDNPTGSYSAKE